MAYIKPGTRRWFVEWIPDADVPQSFKDDEDRDLGDVYKWEKTRAFNSRELAETFAKVIAETIPLFWGIVDLREMEYQHVADGFHAWEQIKHEEFEPTGARS